MQWRFSRQKAARLGQVPAKPLCRPEFQVTETVAAIVAAHRAGHISPAETLARSYQRIRDYNDSAVFISLRDEKDALAEAVGPDPTRLLAHRLGTGEDVAQRVEIIRVGGTRIAREKGIGAEK